MSECGWKEGWVESGKVLVIVDNGRLWDLMRVEVRTGSAPLVGEIPQPVYGGRRYDEGHYLLLGYLALDLSRSY